MKCPECFTDNNKVVSAPSKGGGVARVRRCMTCNKTFTTVELVKSNRKLVRQLEEEDGVKRLSMIAEKIGVRLLRTSY